MEKQLAELKNEIEYLKDELAAHQLVLALLLHPTKSGNIRSDVQHMVNMLSVFSAQSPEKAKIQIHLARLLELAEFPKVGEKSPE